MSSRARKTVRGAAQTDNGRPTMDAAMHRVEDGRREWAVRLGQRHRALEDVTERAAHAEHEATERLLVETRAQWSEVVGAIGALIDAYNSGAARAVLVLRRDGGPSDD